MLLLTKFPYMKGCSISIDGKFGRVIQLCGHYCMRHLQAKMYILEYAANHFGTFQFQKAKGAEISTIYDGESTDHANNGKIFDVVIIGKLISQC